MLAKFISYFQPVPFTEKEEILFDKIKGINPSDTNLRVMYNQFRIIYTEENNKILVKWNIIVYENKDAKRVIQKYADKYGYSTEYNTDLFHRLDLMKENDEIDQQLMKSGIRITTVSSNYIVIKTNSGRKYILNFKRYCNGEDYKFEVADPLLYVPLYYDESVWETVERTLPLHSVYNQLLNLKKYVLTYVNL